MTSSVPDPPSLFVASGDGTLIALFMSGKASTGTRPLLLVHGTSGDHQTWRVVGPMLGRRRQVWSLDRRGRGASGDAPEWSIDREVEDVAAAAEALAASAGGPVDIVGHSLGGRLALAAARATPAIGRVVAYESAPGRAEVDPGLVARLRSLLDEGDLDALLAAFMIEAVGMPPTELAAFRANPVWPLRAAAGPTIVRELEAALAAPAIGPGVLAGVTQPVLQLVGSASPAWFLEGAQALHARLPDGRLEIIEGARHAAHHSHPVEFTSRVEAFLDT